MEVVDTPDQGALISALLDPGRYDPPVERVEKLETHISYILLAGTYAYKIKKAVDLGFLNFRTLSARRFYCEEELRLNRRLAPALYLDVVPITGAPVHPVLGGSGPIIEYAVKMRRFPQEHLLANLLARDRLPPAYIDQLADRIAAFHARAATATSADAFGTPQAIRRPALENFAQLRAAAGAAFDAAKLERLERWTLAQLDALEPVLRARKHAGFVRECHGDFHLGNVALVDGEVTIFDCLEFSADLRWIDVMNEVAFLVMDLRDRKRPDLARRFLNRYLEITGDYEGLRLLRFYAVYRALVRAKVHWLRAHQSGVGPEETERLLAQCRGYLDLALVQTVPARAALIITHGVSGSGKTTHTQALLETLEAVRIRSDVERKRLHGLPALARTGSAVEEGVYSSRATDLTYARLLDLARAVLESGNTAIVDATFLKRAHRDAFRRLAETRAVPFVILDFVADPATLRARLRERALRSDEASEADVRVLEHQLATREPLAPEERALATTYPSTARPRADVSPDVVAALRERSIG